jgi:hypothetical protein
MAPGPGRRKSPEDGTVEHRLWEFAALCNKDSPHPRDWRRFYLFVVYAHQRRAQWDEYELRARLRSLGFDERQATRLSDAYWHIRCALHMTRPRLLNESYRGWMKRGGTAST